MELKFALVFLGKRLYPSCSFWKTFRDRLKGRMLVTSTLNSPGGVHLCLLDFFNNLMIECGEIDGVVLGLWANVDENSSDPVLDQDGAHTGYWAAAAVWSKAWDQRTIDRVSNFSCLSLQHISFKYVVNCVEM